MTEPTIVVLPDPAACSTAAAERIVEILDVAIDERGEAHWATTGGSTPAGIYAELASDPLRDEIDWRKVHLWWTDERFVPADHPLSNAKIAFDVLLKVQYLSGQSGTGGLPGDVATGRLGGLGIPEDHVHPIPTFDAIGEGRDEAWCAARYVEELQAEGPETNDGGWPVFDLMMLGVGPDGHILSVFPGSETFDSRHWVVDVPAPTHVEPHVSRITLNPAIASAAAEIVVVSYGEAKGAILHDILKGDRDEHRLPAQLARRPGAIWYLDRAAAAGL